MSWMNERFHIKVAGIAKSTKSYKQSNMCERDDSAYLALKN